MAVGDAGDIVELVKMFLAVGVSKFVLRPLATTDEEMLDQTRRLSREVIPYLETMS
jgi:hypothetical protein